MKRTLSSYPFVVSVVPVVASLLLVASCAPPQKGADSASSASDDGSQPPADGASDGSQTPPVAMPEEDHTPLPCSTAWVDDAITRMYRGILARDPDDAERKAETDVLWKQRHAGLKASLKALAESDEFKSNIQAKKTPSEILAQFYEGILGPNRTVDPTGLAESQPYLDQGRYGDLAVKLGTSDEFFERSLAMDRSPMMTQEAVKKAYRAILGREADPDGLKAHAQLVQDHGGIAWMQALADMVASDEYAQNVRPAKSDADLLTQLYDGFLGPNRPVDPTGEKIFLPYLAQQRDTEVAVCIGTSDEFFQKLTPPYDKRTGVVKLCGRSACDDQGAFNAHGTTLFWALWGYKFDRERLEQNLAYIAQSHAIDYIRVLGTVGSDDPNDSWADRPADPRWSDYDDDIAGLTDLAYDKYGLRIEWTIFGGIGFTPNASDRSALVDRFLAMSKGREQKLMMFETANEAWQNGFGGADGMNELRTLTRHLKDSSDVLVAASALGADDACTVYGGGTADLATVHFDRTNNFGDGPWRPVRQPWGYWNDYPCSDMPPAFSNNEPIGPYSSVAEERDPLRLTMAAAVTAVASGTMYVLHTGPGVRGGGAADISHGRPANFWETENIEQTLAGLRAMRDELPGDLASWTHHNAQWSTHPFTFDDYDHFVRAYAATSGSHFVVAPIGIKDTAVFHAKAKMSVDIVDPMTNTTVNHYDLDAGGTFGLTGDAWIIRGEWK